MVDETRKGHTPLISDPNLNLEKITRLTPKKYVQEIHYWEARRLLETKEFNSLKMVSFSVGFKDTKNFSRKFKERFGIYPSELSQ